MKAVLTLTYEKEIDEDERNLLQEAIDEGDDQVIVEAFEIDVIQKASIKFK